MDVILSPFYSDQSADGSDFIAILFWDATADSLIKKESREPKHYDYIQELPNGENLVL